MNYSKVKRKLLCLNIFFNFPDFIGITHSYPKLIRLIEFYLVCDKIRRNDMLNYKHVNVFKRKR